MAKMDLAQSRLCGVAIAEDRHEGVEGLVTKRVVAVGEPCDSFELAHAVKQDGEVLIAQVIGVQMDIICNLSELLESNTQSLT